MPINLEHFGVIIDISHACSAGRKRRSIRADSRRVLRTRASAGPRGKRRYRRADSAESWALRSTQFIAYQLGLLAHNLRVVARSTT